MKRLIIALLVIGSLLLGACAPTSTIELKTQEIEHGWVRIEIKDIGSIDYPPDFLELQSGDYRETVEEHFRVYHIPSSDFTLQQVGLNELKPSAFEEYRRVTFTTQYLKPWEKVSRATQKYTMSQAELAELENQLKEQTLREFQMLSATTGDEHKLVESVSLEIKEVNGMFPLVWTYKRQLNDNPVVLVETYMFQNYDKIHNLSFSYRVRDEEECRDIYDKILASFRLY